MAFTDADEITEMTTFDVERVDAVGSPANGTPWLLLKSQAVKAKYSAEQLRKLYKKGHAMKGPHGNIDYPIDDSEDLDNAIRAVGRGNGSHDSIRKYIIGRAKAMGESSKIPDDWNADGSLSKSTVTGVDAGWHTRRKAKVAKKKKMPKVQEAAEAPDQIPEPSVSVSADPPSPTAGADGAPTTDPEPTSDAPLPEGGQGSSLGSQATDPSALLGQTMEVCAPVGGSTDQQARQDAQTQKAKKPKGKKKRSMPNPHGEPDGDAAKASPGSAPWEDTDVAIGKRTIAALRQALGLAQEFTHREETEAQYASAKEIDVTHEELVRLVEQANADVAAARKAAKKERKAKANAKAAKELKKLKKATATDEPVAQARPVLAGGTGAVKSGSVFKELEDRVTNSAGTPREFDARKQLTLAKMISVENARQRGEIPMASMFGPNMTPLLTGAHLMADDSQVRGV